MAMMIAGLVLFFGAHSVAIVAPRWRTRVLLHLRAGWWKGVYSLASGAGLALLLFGFARARVTPLVLYVAPAWLHHVTWLLMLPVFPLLLAAYLPGRTRSAARHPMLAAVKLWATAHLLVNGTLPDVLLFGSFLAWAVAVRISLKRRAPSPAPAPAAPPSRYNDPIALLLGLALYLLFIWRLHALIIGAPLLVR